MIIAATADKPATAALYRVAPAAAITDLVTESDVPDEALTGFAALGMRDPPRLSDFLRAPADATG